MAKKPRTWRCQRVRGGVKCGHDNARVKQKCEVCGGSRPKKVVKDHEKALELGYEGFILLNGGEFCGICGAEPTGKRLDRDHAHVGPIKGRPRGLLCHSCNRTLSFRMEISANKMGLVAWLRAAADYVERAESLAGLNPDAFL